jgi:hypothetical protein
MRIPQAARIMSQDFPEDVRAWIHHLIVPMNQFMTNVTTVLNKGLTFKDHMNSEIKTIRIAFGDQPTISYQLKSRPVGMVVIRSDEELKSPVFFDWENTQNGVRIRNVFGLEPKKVYTLTVLIIGS